MASYAPGKSPLQSALTELGVAPEPAQPTSIKDAFDGIARETSVPANVLIALDEASGGKGSVDAARKNAAAIAREVQNGAKIEEAISKFAGDDARGRAILERSYDIADALYSTGEAPKKPSGQDGELSAGETAGGLARDVATGAVRGVGSAAQALGVAADEIARYGDEEGTSKPTMLRGAGKAAGDSITAVGDRIAAGRSQDYQDRRAGTQISGSLTDPGSWSLGEDPSLVGLLGVAAEGIGSMAPIVAMPGPRAAAVFGGLMAGGEGAQNGRQFVEDAAKTLDEGGRPEIEKLPAYQELTEGGMAPDDAIEEVARRAENNASFRQGLIGSLGGAATNRIMRGAEGWLGQGGRLTRAVKKGAAGSLEEGVQEATEGAASALGIEAGTGADLNVMDESFANFVGGALAGGGMGAVAGAALPGEPRPEQTPDPLALPSPTNGGTIFAGDDRPTETPGADGSGAGPAAALPDQSSLDQGAAATDYPFSDTGLGAVPPAAPDLSGGRGMGALPPSAIPPHVAPPAGPLEAIGAGLASAAPEPERAPTFPDQKPGGSVRLGDPASGAITDAVFMGETPEGMAKVRVNGNVIDMAPAEFDQARNAVPLMERAQKEAEKAAKQAETKAPETPGSLSQAAMQQVTPPERREPERRPEDEMASLSPEDARKALSNLERQARSQGWNTRMGKMRDILNERIALGETADVQPGTAEGRAEIPNAGAVDGSSRSVEAASEDGADQQAGSPDGQGLDQAGLSEHAGRKPTMDGAVGDLDVADGAGKLKNALKAARGNGPVTHTTKKGKAKTGYVMQGVTKAEADAIDPYSFRKDGGIFVNAARADAWNPDALDGEIITPEDDKRRQTEAARAAGFEKTNTPAPQSAPWWLQADEVVREAILDEAGPKVAAEYRKAKSWDRMSEGGRRGLQDAYGKLYRAGRIENAGTIEAPRPAIAKPADKSKGGTSRPDFDRIASDMDEALSSWGPEGNPDIEAKRDLARRLANLSDADWRKVEDDFGPSGRFNPAHGPAQPEAIERLDALAPIQSPRGTDMRSEGSENVAAAAKEAATEPTDAQKEAGNYKMGHARWNGLDLSIETAKGSERRGKGPDGKEWSVKMPADYGYIRKTEGADGDHVDFYMGPREDAPEVYVIDQIDAETGAFDEHKVMLGFGNRKSAMDFYVRGFSDGRGADRMGGHKIMSVPEFKEWLNSGDTKSPINPRALTARQKGRKADPAQDQGTAPKSTAPEHAAVGVDDRELSQIVTEFNDAEASMRDGGSKIHHLFDRPAKGDVVRLGKKAGVTSSVEGGKRVYHRDEGWMTPAEARAKIEEWKAHAKAQGKTRSNADKVVLSLFDLTGSWSQPWEDAGYQVFRFDIQNDPEVGDVNKFSTDFFGDWFGDFDGMDIHAILAACPCTDFAVSGSRHFAAKDADGRTVKSVKLVHQTLATIEHFRPAVWAIENPVGRIEKLGGLPPWSLSFEPFHIGETYTKSTLLWGRMNADLPIAPVEPVEGSKMHTKYGGSSLATKNARSATPEGFAYAFFMANNAIDNPVMALANKFDRLDRKLIADAMDAGVTADQITEAVEDHYYMDLDDTAAEQAIRDLMDGRGPERPANYSSDNSTASESDTKPAPLPKPSERAEMMAEAMGLDDPYTAGRIQDRADSEGWENLAFQFKIEKPGGRHSYAWTDAHGKIIARMKRLGTPKAVKDGRYRDVLSAFVPVAEARFRPAEAFRKAWEAPGEVRAPQKNTPARKRPNIGDPDYTLIDAMNDLQDAEAEYSSQGMVKNARTGERMRKLRDLVKQMQADAEKLRAEAAGDPETPKANWGSFDERSDSDPKIPAGYELTSIRRLTKEEAKAEGYEWPAMKAIVKRDRPAGSYKVESGISENSRANAIAVALERAMKGAEPTPAPETTPPPSGADWEVKRAKDRVMRLRRDRPGSDVLKQAEADLRRARQNAFAEEPEQSNVQEPQSAEKSSTDTAAQTAPGILGSLSQAKQDRAAELKARLAAKARGQASSGLDPEYITLGGELVALYIEAGATRFGQMLRDFAESTGLTLREAQAPMRAAYNHVRDDMDLNGQDVSQMDDAAAVMAEVRAALAEADAAPEASQSSQDDGNVAQQPADETRTDDYQPDERDAGTSPSRDAETSAAQPDRVGGSRSGGGEADARDDGPRREDRGAGAERGADASRSDLSRGSGRTDLAVEREGARNHVIPEGGLALPGGDKTRARNAVKAIETLRTLEREGRPATTEERQALSLYGGAGTLAPALPNSQGKIRFPDIAADLDRLLTDEERATVEKTSQYAFYTAEPVLRNMWNLAQQLGITGGQVFEPGMGVGGFAGTMPNGFFGEYTGIELDHITAKIAAALYPNHNIKHGDFIKTPMINDYYDLAIGNPPFARTQIKADPAYPQGFMIHDYFFAKSLDGVRPGGLLMFVTSAGTLNKMDSKARDYMADRADLVGAIRLPNTAFAENGTQVTTDIIVLRKRHEGEAEANPAWRESTPVSVPDKDGGTVELPVNRYFQDHPEMILGEQGAFDTLVGRSRIGVRPREGADLAADLAAAVARFPRKITSMGDPLQMLTGPRDANSGETKAGSYYMKDGELWQFDGTEGKAVPRRGKGQSGLSKADHELIQDLIPMRDALREVYAADLKGADAKKARKHLNKAYDDFVAKRGPINKVDRSYRRPSAVQMEGLRQQAAEDARAAGAPFDTGSFDAGPMIEEGKTLAQIARARREASQQPGYREGDFDPDSVPDLVIEKFPNIDAFSDDPENFRLRAIERYDPKTGTATKSRVFTENAINMSVRPKISSPEDALLHLLAETGRVDLDRIAELSDSTPAKVREELEGKIFENPATGQFETRAKYLSGNVRKKLRDAESAMRNDDRFKANADALAAVLPDPIPRSQIVVPLGAHWFDQTLYSDFAKAKGLRLKTEFKPALGIWVVEGDKASSEARNTWGTEDMPFADLMRRVMNNKALRVSRTVKNADGTTNTFVDEEATQAASDKAQEIKAAFQEWLWSDEDRANSLEEQYNDTFNSEVAPNYDGSYLTTPGVHSDWRWRPHQTAVIARILQDGSTYMAHTVGAGKTSAMIGAGMEARRLGLARKPWYVVPNHMLVQFATEFQQQYPLADILVADEKRFHTDRRKQFVADAATGEFDAVIITHSAFEKIPASEQAKGRVVSGILDDIREMVESGDETGDRGKDAGQQQATLGALNSIAAQLGIKVEKEKGVSTAKKIAQILEQAEQRLSKLTSDTRKDSVFDFDEIGVDMLFVDEAHLFRKLSFATTNGNIKGIDPSGSQASMDLFIKSRVVDERNPGRGLILASGTPITNTMAELYTLSRLMQPEALAERNISAFDAWAATFGEVASELEQTPDGGYKEVSRFSKFVNTPELSLMVRQIMDVVTSADLEQYVTRPKLKGGGRGLVVVDSTPEQQAFQQTLAARMRAIANRKGPAKKGDDILLSVINDGRLAAIDMRLVDPSSDGAGSKLERMIGNIYQRWKEGAEADLHGVKPGGGYTDKPEMRGPSTQIVFSTLGIDASRHNPDFSVHRYIKAELVRRGVPADQIVLAKDLKSHAQKQRAFNDMNEGKKRILVGSKSIFTGVNAQRRIAALHNLDPLWYPADDEQRNGRGLRQGNMNPEIEILDYSTKGTYDATMWQMMARKASFIEAFYRGDPTQRDMEDLGEASQFEQAKAMTTRDPRVLELTDMKAERDKLRRRAGAVDTQRARLRGEIRRSLREMEFYDEKIERTEPIAAQLPDLSGDKFSIAIGRDSFDSRSDAGKALIQIAEDMTEAGESVSERRVGNIGGFAIEAHHRLVDRSTAFSVRFDGVTDADAGWSDDPVGLARKLEHAMRAPERRLDFYRSERARLEKSADAARKSLAEVKDFAQAEELAQMDEKIASIEAELLADAEKEQDAAKESRFGDDRPVVATLTGDELGEWSDIRDLSRKAFNWYRQNLVGTTTIMDGTGWSVGYTRRGAGKISGRKGEDLLRMVPAIPAIIERGQHVSTEQNRKDDGVKAYHKVAARVELDGRLKDVIVTVREMHNGKFHYDLSRDNSEGALFQRIGDQSEMNVAGSRPSSPILEVGARAASPASFNIEISETEINGDPPLTPARAREINVSARAELAKVGIAGRVRAEAGGSGNATGTYQRGVIRIIRERGKGWRHTLDHEIIHALRDPKIWAGDHGVFTAEEWRALARAARRDKAIRARVEAAYPDLSTAGQTEEMVAELYADWAQGRRDDPPGPIRRAFEQIEKFFRVMSSVLRGQGFHDAATIMEQIASGEFGSSGPDGPGGGGMPRRRNTEGAAFKSWFKGSKAVDAAGQPLVLYHGTNRDFGSFDQSWNGQKTQAKSAKMGFFFASSPSVASTYADTFDRYADDPVYRTLNRISRGLMKKADDLFGRLVAADPPHREGGNVMPVYLSLQNPKVIDLDGESYADETFSEIIAKAKDDGHDGAILKNTFDHGYGYGEPEMTDVLVAFEPSQIKSVFNRGTFDPKDDRILHQRDMTALRNAMQAGRAKAAGMVSREFWQKSPEMFDNWLTDAMGRNSRFNILAAVPGHPLFAELGKGLSAAQTYLRNKQEMDAMRNEWQARASGVVDRWTKTGRKNAEANDALMDLMHKTTLAGIDPTKPDDWKHTHQDSAARILKDGRSTGDRKAWAQKVMAETEAHAESYARLRAAYEALPKEFQDLYGKIRDEYATMADAMDEALIQNIETASRIAGKRAERQHRKELERIRDEGLEGAARDEAIDAADSKLATAQKRATEGKGARMASMRQAFESNRLSGPYFPLARFGNYFVTIRDTDGKVVSFSRFEKKSQQDAFIREAGDEIGQVERGVLGEGADLRSMVDSRFVADVEHIMQEAGASPELLDAVWQHWLETLPDQSVRKNQIHRKGRAGFNADAIRAYSSAMFHGAHQIARLKYGLEMDENLNDAEEQAARQPKPERAGFVVREMRQRHNFTMKPTNNPLVTAGTSLAFIWYLGMSPASAMVNVSQTTIMGVPIMAARFRKAGVGGTADALWKAVQDFGRGKGQIDKSPNLSADERTALAEGYRRGTIDKTQAHDLASVAESGVEYSPAREKAMRVIGFLFHHTERFNREVTFLANYRLLRAEGKTRTEAIDEADAMVKKIHFDYQNTARPRVMQGDMSKLLLVFRNFTVNSLYRLFRDTHQAFAGDTKEAQLEARNQLVGISLSMMAHAGIKGVWGYGLIMAMLGLFYPGGDGDDLEEWLQDSLLMEGDDPGTAAWNWTMGMALNGVPGNVMGVSLTERIGMPNLWFRPARAGTEGRDLWTHYLEQIAGPVAAIPGQFLTGLSMVSDAWGEGNGDNMLRGAEKMVPGFAADVIKPVHQMVYGANTYYGDPLIENVSVFDALRTALGFTPAKLAERYDINNRLKSREKEIMGRRSRIHKAIGNAMMAGEEIPASVMRDLQEFNREYPEYPITPETARASARGRARMKDRNEFGVSLNPKLNDRLRSESAPAIYG